MTTIVDYGCGNLGSIQNMLKKIGEKSIITSDVKIIEQSTRLVLPGVGSFDYGINNLIDYNLRDILTRKCKIDNIPILGVCLGTQLMTKFSEEGSLKGLGFVDASTIKFNFKVENNLSLPNIGWRKIEIKKESPLFEGFTHETWFYFVHKYHLQTNKTKLISSVSNYGYEFISSIEFNNLVGVQFHPEKSHKFGLQLFKNFLNNYEY